MAGEYICLASYARTEPLEARVNVQTYGKLAKAHRLALIL